MQDFTTVVRETLLAEGACCAGVADLGDGDLSPFPDLPTAVVFAVPLDPQIVTSLAHGASPAYAREYERVNEELAGLVTRLVTLIEEVGFGVEGMSPTSGDFDRETLAAAFPHKTAATRAGLGWVGKCALLVTREYGSAVRFATVFTDASLTPDVPVTRSYCGTCTACLDACPAGAPSGREWYPGIAREDFWDAYACCREADRVAKEIGCAHPVCGRCIAACPWTRKYLQRAPGDHVSGTVPEK